MTPEPEWRYDAVLLAGFGGPDGPDDVMPFLRNVTRGRGIPDDRLASVAEHYFALGGASPINAQTQALRDALRDELARRGVPVPVLWGNRNWSPYLAETLAEARRCGMRRLLGLVTSAYSSYSSCRQYREDFAAALIEVDAAGTVVIDKVRPYYDLPGFLAPTIDGLVAALDAARGEGLPPAATVVLFTTHSIPLAMADASGTERDGRLYVEQHLAACREVVRQVAERTSGEPAWRLVYQSRSGPPEVPWLEPDIGEAIAEVAGTGARAIVVVPIGFVSDHVEVIWDLDTDAARTAAEHGVWFRRVATPGVDPRFVSGLADLVVERLAAAAQPVASATSLPARPGSCPAGCCRGRVRRPTTAAVDSWTDWSDTGFSPAVLAGSGLAGSGLAGSGAAAGVPS